MLYISHPSCKCSYCSKIRAITMVSQEHLSVLRTAVEFCIISSIGTIERFLMINKVI